MKQLHNLLRRQTIRCGFVLSLIVLSALQVVPAIGQDDDDDRQHERKMRDAIRSEERRKKFNVESWLKEQDSNKDGVLSPEEIPRDRTRRYMSSIGIKYNSAKPIATMVKEINTAREKKTDAQRKEFERKLSTLASFGAEQESQGVSGFGVETKAEGVESFTARSTGLRTADFDQEQIRDAEKLLRNFDRDENGFLDGDEIARAAWSGSPPETSDLNRDGRLSKLELAKRFQQRDEAKSKANVDNRQSDSDRYKSERKSGRGSTDDDDRGRGRYDRDRGRDKDRDRDRRDREREREARDASNRSKNTKSVTATASASTKVTPAKPRDKNAKLQKYVNEKFATYDANKDGRLDKEEVAKSRMFQKAEDDNGDGFLDKSEALVFVSGGKKKSKSPKKKKAFGGKRKVSVSASSPSGRTTAAASGTGDRRALDKLDKDQDGQIQMHEFTDNWTADKLNEFRDKDKNGDGILSASEWKR